MRASSTSSPDPLGGGPRESLEAARRLARYLVFDRNHADDVAQEAMRVALRRPPGPGRSPTHWLRGIVRNVARAFLRREKRRKGVEGLAADLQVQRRDPSIDDPATLVARAEEHRRAIDAVLRLEEPYRATLIQRFLEDLSPGKIAERHGVPLETVRTRIRRGLDRVRADLDASHGGDRRRWMALLTPTLAPRLATAPVPAIVATPLLAGIGGLAMKKIAAALLVLLLAGGAWRIFQASDRDAPSVPSTGGSPPAATVPDEATLAERGTSSRTLGAASSPTTTSPWVVRGRVFRDMGVPAPGVRIEVRAHAGFDANGKLVQETLVETDPEGAFSWPLSVPTEPQYLLFQPEGRKDDSSTEHRLALPDAPPPVDVVLHLFERNATVFGRVTDESGRPIPRAVVIYRWPDRVECGEDGTYDLGVYSGGSDARLYALAPGYAAARTTAALKGPGSRERVDFRLRPEMRVVGRVLDPEGRAVEGAVVKCWTTLYADEARSGEDGRFRLGHLDPIVSRHTLFARHPEFAEARTDVSPPGPEIEVVLALGRGTRIEGRVVDEEGNALPGASVYLGLNAEEVVARDEGRFVYPAVAPGEHRLSAARPGYAPNIQTLTVSTGSQLISDLVVTLRKGRRVAGVTATADGKPVDGVLLSLRERTTYLPVRTWSDAAGRFTFAHVPDGDVQIEAYSRAHLRTLVPLQAGEVHDLAIVLPLAAGLHGRVIDGRTGEPIDTFVIRIVEPRLEAGEERGFGYGATWSREGHRFSATSGYWNTQGEQLREGSVFGIEATAEGFAPGRDPHVVATSDAKAPPVLIQLFRGVAVHGTVVLPDGTAARGAIVRLVHPTERASRSDPLTEGRGALPATDALGGFRLEGVLPGRVHLAAELPGQPPLLHGPVDVAERDVDVGTLRLPRGGTIEGVAADEEARPLAGVEVVVTPVGDEDSALRDRTWKAVTDAHGRFVVNALPRGRLQVSRMLSSSPNTPALTDYAVTITLAEGERRELRLAPAGSAVLRGRVVASPGVSATETRVLLMPRLASADADPLPTRSAPVVNGRFEFTRVEPGTYTVTWSAPGPSNPAGLRTFLSASASVTLTESAASEVELRVEPR